MWYIELDKENRPIGFYPENHPSIPVGAIEVDDDLKERLYSNIETVGYVQGKEVSLPKKVISESPEVKVRRRRRREVELDQALNSIKNMTPNEAYDMVMQANGVELQKIVASIAKYIAWQYTNDT